MAMVKRRYGWITLENRAEDNDDTRCMMYQCTEPATQGAFGQRLCPTHHRLALKTAQEVLRAAEKFRPR